MTKCVEFDLLHNLSGKAQKFTLKKHPDKIVYIFSLSRESILKRDTILVDGHFLKLIRSIIFKNLPRFKIEMRPKTCFWGHFKVEIA
ncbi:MAG: hypothetical protein H6Q19_1628 [Bacteroidetes bacterium]|nr:hypothetical protein [Bacteroidota bacterium]